MDSLLNRDRAAWRWPSTSNRDRFWWGQQAFISVVSRNKRWLFDQGLVLVMSRKTNRKRRGKRRRRGNAVAPLVAKNPKRDRRNGCDAGKGRPTLKQSKNAKQTPRAGEYPTPENATVENTHTVASTINLSDPAVSKWMDKDWFDEQPVPPAHPDRFTPEQCTEFRGRLSEWLANGLRNAQNRNDVSTEPGTPAACWDGKVVNVDIASVIVADNTVMLAGQVSQGHGYAIVQPCRGHVGLDEDSDMRVLQWVCEHDGCQSGNHSTLLEMKWPVGNAVLESWDPNTGFITPRTAMDYEKFQRGMETSDGDMIDEWATRSLTNRLRISSDPRRHKPIDTRRIIRDRHGDLLTVPPEIRPRAKVNPAYTTPDCSCGHRQKMALSQSAINCAVCGPRLCRDVNAAKNARPRGFPGSGGIFPDAATCVLPLPSVGKISVPALVMQTDAAEQYASTQVVVGI